MYWQSILDGGLWLRWVALAVFISAGITDVLDGYFARMYGQQSSLGRMLDPIADKLLVASCLLMLAAEETIRGWSLLAAVVILCREILVSGLREYLAELRVSVPVSRLAKWKTTWQLVAVGFLIAGEAGDKVASGLQAGHPVVTKIGLALLWLSAMVTLYTGWDYMRAGVRHMIDMMKLRYFAWVRERVGKAEEDGRVPPRHRDCRRTNGMACFRGEEYAHAFEKRERHPRRHRPKPRTARRRDQRCRRNRVFPAHDRRIASPSTTGYIESMTSTVRLQREPFDPAVEAAELARGRSDVGALVTFTGVCRGTENGEPIAALTLEHYPGMAESEIERHVAEAIERWPLLGVTVIHRYGRIDARREYCAGRNSVVPSPGSV